MLTGKGPDAERQVSEPSALAQVERREVVLRILEAAKAPGATETDGSRLHAFGTKKAIASSLDGINTTDGEGNSALMLATVQGDRRAVRALLQAGADRTLEDGEGRTPLMVACGAGDTEMVAEFGLEDELLHEETTEARGRGGVGLSLAGV